MPLAMLGSRYTTLGLNNCVTCINCHSLDASAVVWLPFAKADDKYMCDWQEVGTAPDDFEAAFLELQAWVDTSEEKYALLHAKRLARKGRSASALK